nr:MAG TPA: hypothetical protein [Caudoviricetes sp.]
MGEEKKDSLQSVMDAVADVIEDYVEVVEEYAYLKAQLDTLKRYVCKNIYIERDMILKLMGWDEDGKH